MNIFVLKNTFIKIYIYHFSINIFIEKKSKLCFGDRVAFQNDFLYEYRGSTCFGFPEKRRAALDLNSASIFTIYQGLFNPSNLLSLSSHLGLAH